MYSKDNDEHKPTDWLFISYHAEIAQLEVALYAEISISKRPHPWRK